MPNEIDINKRYFFARDQLTNQGPAALHFALAPTLLSIEETLESKYKTMMEANAPLQTDEVTTVLEAKRECAIVHVATRKELSPTGSIGFITFF